MTSPAMPMRKLAAVFAVLVLTLCLAGTAFAHASLIASVPAQNDVIASAPPGFTLAFNEPVSPVLLNLVSPDGSVRPLADIRPAGNTLEIAAPQGLGTGTFVLSYRVISDDGHPIGGSVIFSIGTPGAGVANIAPQGMGWPLGMAIWTGKIMLYAGLFFGIGGVFFGVWLAPGTGAGRRPARTAVAAGLVAAPVLVGLQGLDALGLPLDAFFRHDVWMAGATTSFGLSAGIAAAAMALALLAHRMPPGAGRALSLLALAGAGLALAATGHASAADPRWLTGPAVFVHALAIAFWAGALIPLVQLLGSGTPAALAALRRFSRAIPFALLALIVAGVVLAIIQLGSAPALIHTAYGLVLLAKLGLLIAVFCLAAVNRWALTRSAAHGEPLATRRLMRIIAVETVLLLAVMGVAGAWRFTPPPRSLASVSASPLPLHIHTDKAMAQITFASGRAGPNSADIVLLDGAFLPLEAQELTLIIGSAPAGVQPGRYRAHKQAGGGWRVKGLIIPVAANWSVRLDIRVSDFEMVKVAGEVAFSN